MAVAEALVPWLRVGLAVLVYLAAAAGAMAAVRRTGVDLRDVASRTSPVVLAIGAAGNLAALAGVLVLLTVVDGRPVADLGLGLTPADAAVVLGLSAANFGLGWLWVRARSARSPEPAPQRAPAAGGARPGALALGVAVLALVALQEEVLYRGYAILNLEPLGWPVALAASTAVFVAVHFLTNRASRLQAASWAASGLALGVAYLASGSIWVPVGLHFAIDLSNVVVFDVAGRAAAGSGARRLADRDRSLFRVGFAVLVIVAVVVVYGGPG